MDKQKFIDGYLNTIIEYRKKYLQMEQTLSGASASEVEFIIKYQKSLAQELLRFILKPKINFSFGEQKEIDYLLDE